MEMSYCDSTIAFVIFIEEVILLLYLFWREWRGAADRRREMATVRQSDDTTTAAATTRSPGLGSTAARDENSGARIDCDAQFLFDVVYRQHTSIVQNIDALDGALIAVAVGVVALGLFIGDKWFEIDDTWRCAGLFVLGEATLAVILGYLTIYFGAGAEDPGKLADFVVDFSSAPVEATFSAIENFTRSAEMNVQIRRWKRSSIVLSTVLVFAAASLAIVGRSLGLRLGH